MQNRQLPQMHILASFTKLIDCFDSMDIQQNSTITETARCVNIHYHMIDKCGMSFVDLQS